ncbi:hypothetical protein FH609_013085 [Streptomyces sp. 3MP-14]|uniref:Uncharacterized protein n=1 Tax=Streptomyces mimosae TaxID=2586635 RepID=A0A5N6A658_9ACTN|nr:MULTISPECIES: hypothetical protein [Streptomyces]KAB8164151.1 hypothetical protein FH607_015975 [Streptomyces mimosae]KAB8176428.1 hypothetical protein FH609_013085 [Streptomyces sp. 3MP-14]
MGIEDEQLVFDYLSRVGDLAHGTAMSSAERARLVNRLRDEIGRARADAGSETRSAASVRRILGKLGSPEDVVARAAGDAPPAATNRPARPRSSPSPSPSPAPSPPARSAAPLPAQRERPARRERPGSPGADGPEVPMRWPTEELPRGSGWQQGPEGQIAGFSGGIDIPELMHPSGLADAEPGPATEAELTAAEAERETADASLTQPVVEDADPPRPRRRARLARAVIGGRRRGGIVELAGVVALVGGAVAGSLPALALGWVLAYWSPRLGQRERQWATFGMPALVATVYGVWLMGRLGGNWGEPLADGEIEKLLANDWPLLLRLAAFASAAFLLFRARRPVREG